jgi:hypothetical protein
VPPFLWTNIGNLMKNQLYALLMAFSVLFLSCTKEPLSSDDFSGNWKCDSYTYVYWQGEDSTASYTKEIAEECTMNVSGGNQFYFGFGEANMPLQLDPDVNGSYENSLPRMFDGPFAIQSSSDGLTGVNNWDMTECTTEYGDQRQLRATCQFKKISENKLNVKVLLRMTTGLTHKYTYALLEMEK